MRLALAQRKVQLRGADGIGERVQRGGGVGRLAQDLQQARPGVLRVVESIPAFYEESVAAHLARERRAALAHPRLDERMAGLPQARHAAVFADPGREVARALHVVDDLGARLARKDILREQHQLPVRKNDLPLGGHHAQPVAVAVESEPDLTALPSHQGNQVLEVLRVGRIGMMIGKAAIDLAVELQHFAAEAAVELARRGAGDAVTAVDRDFHRAHEPYVGGNSIQIGFADVRMAVPPRAASKLAGLDPLAQPLDILARESGSRKHHLQSVVLGRIVAARDRDRAAATEMVRGEISDRGCEHPDLRDVHAACANALRQRASELGSGDPTVAAHCDLRPPAPAAAVEQLASERLPDQPNAFAGEGFADDAADVIGLEDFRRRKTHL